MFSPVRALLAPRSKASPGVLAAAGTVALAFAATPFLVPEIADSLNVRLGTAGLISTFQVGGFAATSFIAGRLLRPQAFLHRLALYTIAVANVFCVFVPEFWMVLGFQLVAGVGMGLVTWLAWAEATRHRKGLSDVAAIGPLVACISSPVLSWLAHAISYRAVFAVVAICALVVSFVPAHYGDLPVIGRNVSDSRTNVILLVALFLLTASGSAVFVFAAAAGRKLTQLSPFLISLSYSLNALVGVVATRRNARRGTAGFWLFGTSVGALLVGFTRNSFVYMAAMIGWGFVFWMGIPAVFKLLGDRSLSPAERIGDAQALMAAGRVFGPLVGGAILGAAAFDRLSVAGAIGLALGSGLVLTVELIRRSLLRSDPPRVLTDQKASSP